MVKPYRPGLLEAVLNQEANFTKDDTEQQVSYIGVQVVVGGVGTGDNGQVEMK